MHVAASFVNQKASVGVKRLRRSFTVTYLVVIIKAGATYCAHSPDVPGCIATSTSLEEAKEFIREGLAQHLELSLELGLPVPESKTITYTGPLGEEEKVEEVDFVQLRLEAEY